MTYLILGTPDSGKSLKAESTALSLAGSGRKYYIATMIPFGKEGEDRIKKHRKMREGKGFETIEQPVRVHEALSRINSSEASTCLLECMSNLIGNEMHDPSMGNDETKDLAEIADGIVDSVMSLADKVLNLVIVSNTFPLDGEGYDEDTRRYVKVVDLVNKELKQRVDEVYELT